MRAVEDLSPEPNSHSLRNETEWNEALPTYMAFCSSAIALSFMPGSISASNKCFEAGVVEEVRAIADCELHCGKDPGNRGNPRAARRRSF